MNRHSGKETELIARSAAQHLAAGRRDGRLKSLALEHHIRPKDAFVPSNLAASRPSNFACLISLAQIDRERRVENGWSDSVWRARQFHARARIFA